MLHGSICRVQLLSSILVVPFGSAYDVSTSTYHPMVCYPLLSLSRLTDLSGSLTDGPVNYKYKTKCTWLIEG